MADRPSLLAAWSRFVRPTGALLILVGAAHLVVPGRLLATARTGYRTVLDVEFDPGESATTRVRLLGVLFLAVGAHLCYHGRAIPWLD